MIWLYFGLVFIAGLGLAYGHSFIKCKGLRACHQEVLAQLHDKANKETNLLQVSLLEQKKTEENFRNHMTQDLQEIASQASLAAANMNGYSTTLSFFVGETKEQAVQANQISLQVHGAVNEMVNATAKLRDSIGRLASDLAVAASYSDSGLNSILSAYQTSLELDRHLTNIPEMTRVRTILAKLREDLGNCRSFLEKETKNSIRSADNLDTQRNVAETLNINMRKIKEMAQAMLGLLTEISTTSREQTALVSDIFAVATQVSLAADRVRSGVDSIRTHAESN